eukprot:SM000055S18318  [mRNA]  locus=s55:632417:632761:+ [translate_table: standard]
MASQSTAGLFCAAGAEERSLCLSLETPTRLDVSAQVIMCLVLAQKLRNVNVRVVQVQYVAEVADACTKSATR